MSALLGRVLGRLPIGWLQLLHNRVRLVAAVGGVSFANILIFMQLGFMNALFETSVLTHRSFQADLVLASADTQSLREAGPIPRVRMHQALGAAGIVSATPVYLGTALWNDARTGDTTNFRVVGVDPARRTFADPELQAAARRLVEPDTALIDLRTRELQPWIPSAIRASGRCVVELGGRRLSLVGTFSQGASFDVDGTLIVSDQTFLRLFPARRAGTPSLALLGSSGADEPARQRLADALNGLFPEADVRAFTLQGLIAAEQRYQARQSPIGFVFGFGVAIGLVVGLVIVYQVLATDVQDHLAEYATFKAMGYAPRFFLGVVFEEALCLAALGFLPGLAVSLVLYAVAAQATALPIVMPWQRPLLVFALTAAMCAASGAIATRRLNSADPAELF